MCGHAVVFKGVDLPKPFWTVRLMGTVRRREHSDCGNSAGNSEVTVVPVGDESMFNPVNLRVTCLEHDCYPRRRQTREVAAQAWGISLA